MNILKGFFTIHIDWDYGYIRIANIIITKDQLNAAMIKIFIFALIVVIMYLSIKIGNGIINRTLRKQGTRKFSLDEKKAKTLGAVLKSILRYTVYFFGIGAILTNFFGAISLTFASIGGVAIGFGAQNLVKDVINGFFILFEDQYAVGDNININDKGGIVESIELRVTKLRDFNGDLHIIPNGLINQVTNHSRGNMRALIDIDISYEENIDNAIDVIQKACDAFKERQDNVVEGPKVLGVAAMKDNIITIRVFAKTKSGAQWDCESGLRRVIKKALDESSIKTAYPIRKIINS